MSKRLIAFVLTLALVFSCVPAVAFATDAAAATLNVADVYATPGGTVTVGVEIENNPGILGATLTVSWDEGLTLVDSASGAAFSELTFQAPSRYTNGCNFVWYGSSISKAVDGPVLLLTFEVPATATDAQSYDITVSYDRRDVLDQNYNTVDLTVNNGSVRIVTYTPGDVTGDDRINPLDLIKLSQYISDGGKADPEGYNAVINESAADVNDDGRINPLDLIWISQYISDGCKTDPEGYNRTLYPSTPKCVHVMQATGARAATCTEEGNIAYWYCMECGKYYSNEAGSVEVKLEDTVLAATGHTEVIDPYVAPSKTASGWTQGAHCAVCGYVITAQEEIPPITGYLVNYEIANGEDYIESQNVTIPVDKVQYFSDEGLELPQLKVPGYRFIGWSRSQASSDNIVTRIEVGETGDQTFYAHWDIIEYTVTFDSPDIPVDSITYTVDKGATLTNPYCFGYTFMGWSNDDGFVVNRIKPGTTGHMTLRANWTSDRNKATSYQNYGEPIIIEDDTRGQFLFIYNIGKIDNVPLNEVEFIGKTERLDYKKEVSVVDTVDEKYVEDINLMISQATTKSSGWTLSKDWNELYSLQEETGSMKGISDERTTTDGKTVGGKYFVSNSEGGSSHVSTESGSSASNSSKITTEDSYGINGSFDMGTETYCDAKVGLTNETTAEAGVKVKYGVAEANAGIKNTTTASSEVSTGRKDNMAFHIDGSLSSYVGTVTNNEQNSYVNSTMSSSSNWNSTSGYESSSEMLHEESVKTAVEEQISEKTTHNLSKALGGSDSNTEEISEQNRTDEEYSTSLTYGKGTQTSTTKSLEFTSGEPGYYRIITAGTVHVYGVVGYNVATNSYFTYCYNVLDDTTREIMDYSKDNMNFDDCQNSVVTFDVPYEVNEYIAGVVGKTDGLEISYDGVVTDFVPGEDFDGTVVIPQYDGKDNADSSYSAVKVTSFSSEAFQNAKDQIEVVVLPIYITEIPDHAFEGCTNLKTVIAYGVTSIGDYAFKDCTSLTEFRVDNKVTHLGVNAFENVPSVAVTAYDSAVADAAISCGAKQISVNISYIADTYENKVVAVTAATESFTLIGNGSTYNNVRVISDATASTMISNMVFANNTETPIKIASETVTLARMSVENSPTFALILTGDNVNVKLLGTVSLSTAAEHAVLSKNVVLSQLQQSTTSAMQITGNYLVCGVAINDRFLNVEPIVITEDEFADYLVSSIVTFNANGGSVEQEAMTVYQNKTYGELPVPERQYHAFAGWYTAAEGGEEVTAETVVTTVVNHTLYAHWEPITAKITFDANGGSVSTVSKIVYTGNAVGDLPVPTRDYYNFAGWSTSDGTAITAATVINEAREFTVYAQWTLKPLSGWVKATDVPSGAQVVNTKWTYDLTTNITSSQSSVAGYTLYKTTSAWSDYGAWSSWSKTAVSKSDSRQVETKTVTDRAAYTNYKYYVYRTSDGYGYGTQGYNTGSHGTCTKYDEINLSYALPVYDSSLGTYGPYNSSMFSHSYDAYWFFGGSSYVPAVTHTEYRYRDRSLIYTYYHTKTEAKESTTEVTASDTISNVVKMVQYRAK